MDKLLIGNFICKQLLHRIMHFNTSIIWILDDKINY